MINYAGQLRGSGPTFCRDSIFMNTLNALLIDLNNGLIDFASKGFNSSPAQFYNTKFVMHALHSIANHSDYKWMKKKVTLTNFAQMVQGTSSEVV